MTLSKNTYLMIAAGVFVIGIGAYFLWGRTPADQSTVSEVAGPTSDAQAEFLTLTAQLEPVAFDQRILSDPRFVVLQDIHTSIVSESSGRNDPFAPLAGVKTK